MCKTQTKKLLAKKVKEAENKMQDVSKLVTNSALNTKIGEVENKIILDASKLVTNGASDAKIGNVENKIPNHDVYITTQELNKLTSENFAGSFKQRN